MVKLASYWEGPVSWMERVSARSMVEAGHELTIYSYTPDALRELGLDGVIRDAREIVPDDNPITRYRAVGRYALMTNLLRLELQRRGAGTWVDLDCLFMKRLEPASPYIFGLIVPGKINGAVLGLPQGEPMSDDYLQAITAVPLHTPWQTWRRRLWREVEILCGMPLPPAAQQTNIGPRALTYFIKKHGLMKHALPQDAFYPVSTNDAHVLVDADDRKAKSSLTERTVVVHLWHGQIKKLGLLKQLPPRTSLAGQMLQRHGIA